MKSDTQTALYNLKKDYEFLRDRYDPITECLAHNLKVLRTDAGMTQDELAIACELPLTLISQYETSSREPRLTNIIKLCKGLNVTASKLIGQ